MPNRLVAAFPARSIARWSVAVALGALVAVPIPALAQSPQQFADDATRYMALGDSLSAGYRVMPATQGFTYLLYQDGVFDRIPHTLFCNAAVTGATSQHVMAFQVPQALIPFSEGGFNPNYITLTVGGNDLLSILRYAADHTQPEVVVFAQQVLGQYGQNLAVILGQLHAALPAVKIFVANQYTIPEIQAVLPFTDDLVDALNIVTALVAGQFPQTFLVDVHGAFLGRNNLLLVERHGASPFEVHPTSVGHRVIEQAFASVIAQNK